MGSLKEFIEFVRDKGIVGLAIGFILGGAVSKVVTALVNDLINPLVGLFIGSAEGLRAASFQVGSATFLYGDFLATLLDFFIVAAIVFFVFTRIEASLKDTKKK